METGPLVMMEVIHFPYSYLINVHFPYSSKKIKGYTCTYRCNLGEVG